MANYLINIEDIPGLADEIQIITNLNNILTYGPIKVNTVLAYKGLEAGYIAPEYDFSYNLNICKDAKIGNNLDVYNNINVMHTGFINKLVVYNLKNYQYQLIFNGFMNDSTSMLSSIYVYIDQYYNIYPAYLTNDLTNELDQTKTIQYLDPISETILTNMIDFDYVTYTQNTQYAIQSLSNSITTIEMPIVKTIIEGNGINFVELTMPLYNNPITVYGIQFVNLTSNNLVYYDQKTNTLVMATIENNEVSLMKGTPLNIKYDQIDKHIYDDININMSALNTAFYVNSSSVLDGDAIVTKNLYVLKNVSIDGTTHIISTLNVSDNVSLMNGLNVSNNTSFVGTLNVTDNVSFLNGLNVSNNTSLVGRLHVTDNVSFLNGLNVSNNTSLVGRLHVTDNVSFLNGLHVSSNTSLVGRLHVTDNVSFLNGLHVSNNTSLVGTLNVTNNVSFLNGLDVSSNTSLVGRLHVTDHVRFLNGLDVSSNTSLVGTLFVTNNVSFLNGLDVSSNTSLVGRLHVTDNVSFLNGLHVSNNTSLVGRLHVTDHVRFLNGLHVSNNTSLVGTLNVTNNVSFLNGLDVSSNTSLVGRLHVTDNVSFLNGLHVSNNTSLVGKLNVTDNVSFLNGLHVLNNTSFVGTLNVTNNVSFLNGLDVSNNTSLVGTLNVTDNVSFLNGLHVSNNTSFMKRLYVNGSTDISGILKVFKDIVCLQDLYVEGNTKFSNTTQGFGLELMNDGERPIIIANQRRPDLKDIAWFQDTSENVFTIGAQGNTVIKGKLKIGYDTQSALVLDATEFDTAHGSSLDISGDCYISKDVKIDGNIQLAGNITSQSDRRIKSNIEPIEDCLQKIKNVTGCKYNRFDLDGEIHIGLIAQEVEEVFPELVTETNNVKGINYQGFIAVLLNCIKELNKKIEKLEDSKIK